jgi:carboxyvinyl-carboxyphosphonate phosphorylmutase
VRVALQGHLPIQAAIQAVHATLKALREGPQPADVTGTAPPALAKMAGREAEHAAWTKAFLG